MNNIQVNLLPEKSEGHVLYKKSQLVEKKLIFKR